MVRQFWHMHAIHEIQPISWYVLFFFIPLADYRV